MNEWEEVKTFKASGSRVSREREEVLPGAAGREVGPFFLFFIQ